MPYNLRQRQRRASRSSSASTLSIAETEHDPEPEQQHGSQSSQSSQSSRIVTVPRGEDHVPAQARALAVVAKIEAIFEAMVDVLTDGGDSLTMPYRRSRDPPERPLGSLKFPGRNLNESAKFTQMMRIMELSREALMSGRLITKRNIYYQNTELFKSQTVVNHLVDDLACTLQIGRCALNIVAASKGLIAGPLRLIMESGAEISFASEHDNSNSIPPTSTIHQVDFADTKWILVIEKEATFRTLAACQYWKHCVQGRGIIVTGKGYADLATLEFLNLIHTLRPTIPLLCVVDCDPHGIDIMRTYKHGSKALGHETNTRVPGLHWIGVRMDDVFLAASRQRSPSHSQSSQDSNSQLSQSTAAGASQDSNASSSVRSTSSRRTPLDSLMQLSPTDRQTAQRILRSIPCDDDDVDRDPEDLDQRYELQVMLMLNMKAEIQAIDDMGDLSSWLNEKMGVA